MKNIYLLFYLIFMGLTTFAQPEGSRKNKQEQIEKAKISFISERLILSEEQKLKFWPVYNEYSGKRMQLMMAIRKMNKQNKNTATSDDQIQINLNKILESKQLIITLEKDYMPRFLSIITPRQLDTMQKAEKEFMKMLRKRLEEKKQKQ